ncbi:acyl-CoA esterase, partial [Yersinia enterocolitica]|nr:acyl-CoA esterase [Yersinia enterocolitica]
MTQEQISPRGERLLPGGEQVLPNGELVLRTLAMPADTNANGDIFGGWLMSQMDIG